jgi:hypothetical protein
MRPLLLPIEKEDAPLVFWSGIAATELAAN